MLTYAPAQSVQVCSLNLRLSINDQLFSHLSKQSLLTFSLVSYQYLMKRQLFEVEN